MKHPTTRNARTAGRILVGLVAVGLVALGSGCSSDTKAEAANEATTTTTAAAKHAAALRAPVQATSTESRLIKVGVDDARTYGWNKLVGPTETDLGPFDMEMLGNVDYEHGDGPFYGFIDLVAPSGDLIGIRMNGEATVRDDGVTSLAADLEVIGGTGEFVRATGEGDMTGTRQAVVGAPIDIVIELGLDNVRP